MSNIAEPSKGKAMIIGEDITIMNRMAAIDLVSSNGWGQC
jgi:hypothetical protein